MIDSNTQNQRSLVGKTGEEFAAEWLQSQGYTILAQNYRTKFGELDIIALRHEILVFVEVKTRKTAYFELSSLVVPGKQRKIIATAKRYVLEKRFDTDLIYRFDIALVQGEHPHYTISYIENAFTENKY